MAEIFTTSVCYLCEEEAQVQDLQASYLVDCPRCGAYEIEAVATTLKADDYQGVLTYLEKERKTGMVRPMVIRELLRK